MRGQRRDALLGSELSAAVVSESVGRKNRRRKGNSPDALACASGHV